MRTKFDISVEVARLKSDYVAATGEPAFEHFFCPILLRDEESELCAGHVINDSIPRSCRARVVQRKDIDGFFGSLVESEFATVLELKGMSVDGILENPRLRRRTKPSFFVDGQPISYYEAREHVAQEHPLLHMRNESGDFLTVALKVSPNELPASAKLDIVVDRDYVPEATASLLKAAHLTMFAICGYDYVFSAAGQDLARILRDFYAENHKASRLQAVAAAREYFQKFSGMIMPVVGFDGTILKGSVQDSRFMVCVGASGQFFALGVLVRTNDQMSVVFLAPDRAEPMGTYMQFIRERSKPQFRYHLADLVQDVDGRPKQWNAFKNLFVFDPDKREP